jgi:hypothetical protein
LDLAAKKAQPMVEPVQPAAIAAMEAGSAEAFSVLAQSMMGEVAAPDVVAAVGELVPLLGGIHAALTGSPKVAPSAM